MLLQFSAEIHAPAADAYVNVAAKAEPLILAKLPGTILEPFECTLRYVPVVMPSDMDARYSARSRVYRKKREYDCCPTLNYEIFVSGAFAEQVREYIRGLRTAEGAIGSLGASAQQVSAYIAILDAVEAELSGMDKARLH